MKKTLVLGASTNPARYSNIATKRLLQYGHEVVLIGLREGEIQGNPILTGMPPVEGIDTITLYMNPARQIPFYDYILSLNPKRIVFNPGTENHELMKLAREQGILPEIGCTLVMLAADSY